MNQFLKRLILCVPVSLLVMLPALSSDVRLPVGIRSITDAPRYQHALWGILVSDLESGKTVYEMNSDKLFRPGSNVKLYTMATSLSILGSDYRFSTPVYRLRSVGDSKGLLVLVASGDLTMGGRTLPDGQIAYTNMDHGDAGLDGPLEAILTKTDPLAGLNQLAMQVAASGVKHVDDVVIDDRLFETMTAPAGFIRTPIIINDNLIDFIIRPGRVGERATVIWQPMTTAYSVNSQVTTSGPHTQPEIDVDPVGPRGIVVRGHVPAGYPEDVIRTYTVLDPASFARSLFIEALRKQNVSVDGSPLDENPSGLLPARDTYKKMNPVAVLVSPPYSETVKLILKVSHNLGADTTPLVVASTEGKRTFGDGMSIENDFLQGIGLDTSTISLSDGQGGVASDLVSPKMTVQLLRAMSGRKVFSYRKALPILGIDGSLADSVGPNNPARGHVFAKTGTVALGNLLTGTLVIPAKALSGYVNTASGRRLVFSVFVNNVTADNLDDLIAVGNDLAAISVVIYKSQ